MSEPVFTVNPSPTVISCRNLIPIGVDIKRGELPEHVLAFYEPVGDQVYFSSYLPNADSVREAVRKFVKGSMTTDSLIEDQVDWGEINMLTGLASASASREE